METPDKIKVGIVEDDLRYRARTIEILEKNPAIEQVSAWSSAEGFWRDPFSREIDLLFLDVMLPGMDGVELVRDIMGRQPDTRVIMLTNMNSDEIIFEALQNGAVGYILKTELESIETVVPIVLGGGAFITPTIAFRVLKNLNKAEVRKENNLTGREKQILDIMITGKSIPRVAEFLGLSKHTIHTHVKNIYRKLNVHNRVELARKAAEAGLL